MMKSRKRLHATAMLCAVLAGFSTAAVRKSAATPLLRGNALDSEVERLMRGAGISAVSKRQILSPKTVDARHGHQQGTNALDDH